MEDPRRFANDVAAFVETLSVGDDAGPDETTEMIALWHKARRSLLKSRQHLLNEAEALLCELPEAVRSALPDTSEVRPRLVALAGRDRSAVWDAATALRLRLLDDHAATVADLDAREKEAARELGRLIKEVEPLEDVEGLASGGPAARRRAHAVQVQAPVADPGGRPLGGHVRLHVAHGHHARAPTVVGSRGQWRLLDGRHHGVGELSGSLDVETAAGATIRIVLGAPLDKDECLELEVFPDDDGVVVPLSWTCSLDEGWSG